jgi:hypothetical protein
MNVNDFSDLNLSNYDEGPSGPPRIWWWTEGKFYTKFAEFGFDLEEPWMESHRFTSEHGFEAHQLELALIAIRKRPFVMDSDGKRVYIPEWRDGINARMHTEILALVSGMGDEPVVISVKGMTGRALADIKLQYENSLLRHIRRKVPKGTKVPLWACWLPIGAEYDARGNVVRTKTGHGSNAVALPILKFPSDDMDQCYEALYVGRELLKLGAELYDEYRPWREFEDVKGARPESEESAKDDDAPSSDDDEQGADMPF